MGNEIRLPEFGNGIPAAESGCFTLIVDLSFFFLRLFPLRHDAKKDFTVLVKGIASLA